MKNSLTSGSRSPRPLSARRALTAVALLAAAAFVVPACSGDDDAGPQGQGGSAAEDDLLPSHDIGQAAKCFVADEFSSCFESCQNAAVGPANLYIMFDRSLSMENDGKWENATAALKSFFSSPASAGLGVALRFFPDSGCDEQACDVAACSEPAVPLGTLSEGESDPHRDALVAALDKRKPFGGTPMHPALEGAIRWAETQLEGEPVQRPVVVLVTDGAPFGCHTDAEDVNQDVENLAALAAEAYEKHGIFTYVVGLEGSWEWIVDKIAKSGGTGKAILVSNEKTEEELFGALQSIKESHVDCEVGLPTSTDLSELDPAKVNVTYTAGGAGDAVTLDQVPGASDCAGAGGWYFDDPEAPTKISLCPGTCSEIQADKWAKLDVVLGCVTQIPK